MLLSSDIFNNFAISSIAFLVSGPAYREGTVVEGGLDRMLIMSDAACAKKSDNLTDGKGMECGKNSTVSELATDFVRGI